MKRIGLLCLALVLALGALGVGYAMWSDTVTIEGTVDTGDVDVNVEKVSSTWVYKNLETHDKVVVHEWGSVAPTPPPNSELIASAVAKIGVEDDTVTVTCTNLFPSVDFKVDFLLHYDGSIPARFVVGSDAPPVFEPVGPNVAADVALAEYLNRLFWSLPSDPGVGYAYGEMWECDSTGAIVGNIPALEGYQLHEGDYILVVITFHLGEDAPMNGSVRFTHELEVVQWNEYGV